MSHKCIVLVNEAWTATSQGSPRLNNTQCTQNRSHNSNWCGWHFPILLEHICTVTWSCVSQLWLILSFCKWKFSRHKFMWIPVLSLQSTCYNTGPCRFFPTAIPKLRDDIWEMKVLIQALMVSVIAWVLPTNIYKVPLLLLGMKPQLFFFTCSGWLRYGGIFVVDHTHIVNLTSNLIELWLFFAALVLFTLPMTVLNYSSSSRLISIDPSRSKLLGLLSPLAKQARTPSLHSLYFTFIQLSPPPNLLRFS